MPKIFIDPIQEHYAPFFSDEWGQKLLDTTRNTALYDPAFSLAISWKSQSQAHALPWVLIESLKSTWSDPAHNPVGFIRRWLRKLTDELFAKVDFTNMKRKEVRKALGGITERFEKLDVPPVDMKPTWKALCDESDFHTGLNGLMRDCFCTLYHDYENYLRRVVSAVKGEEVRFFSKDHIVTCVAETLGASVAAQCYSERAIDIPRRIRNSFAHAGGKETHELKAVSHNLPTEDGVVHILASHTIELYGVLSSAVEAATQAALAKLPAG